MIQPICPPKRSLKAISSGEGFSEGGPQYILRTNLSAFAVANITVVWGTSKYYGEINIPTC